MLTKKIELKLKNIMIDKKLLRLENFCNIIQFLNKQSWKYSNSTERWDFLSKLKNDIEPHIGILIHWLIYIYDRAKKAENLWENAYPPVKKLLDIYFKDNIKTQKHVDNIYDPETGDIYEDALITGKLKYLPDDNKSIAKTLKTLLDYDKNIIKYLKENFENWKEIDEEENFCPSNNNSTKLAYLLYRLSFHKNEDILNKGYLWHKRIWAALRDYVLWNKLSNFMTKGLNLLLEIPIENWIDYFEIDISNFELPGDIWNNRFVENFHVDFSNDFKDTLMETDFNLKNIIKRGKKKEIINREIHADDFSTTNYPFSKLIRIFYNNIILPNKKKDYIKTDFVPIDLDFSFTFTSNHCAKDIVDICKNICVFGSSGGQNLCNPKSKICPIGYVAGGYINNCIFNYEEKCPIYNSKGKNLCQKTK